MAPHGKHVTPEELAEFKAKLSPTVDAALTKAGEEGLTDRTLRRCGPEEHAWPSGLTARPSLCPWP